MKYRKKPVVIEAYVTNEPVDIETLEGTMHANPGDYIITGVNGEQYPCKPDIFAKTYEPADSSNPQVDRDALLELLRMFESDASLSPYESEEDAANETLYTRANVRSHINRMRKALGVVDS